MVNIGGPEVRILDDEWTAVTADGSVSAHFEHTVLVTEGEPEVLTRAGLLLASARSIRETLTPTLEKISRFRLQ